MKNIIICIFILLSLNVVSTYSQDGWYYQNSGVSYNIVAVDFSNPDLGIAITGNGLILRTANGGNTWEQIPLPKGYTQLPALNSVVFFNTATVVIYANGQYVQNGDTSQAQFLRSTDAGLTWQVLSRPKYHSGVSRTLQKISPTIGFFAENLLYSVNGIKGYILKTTDAGLTWSRVDSSESNGNRSYYTGLSVADVGRWISSEYYSQDVFLYHSAEIRTALGKRKFTGRTDLTSLAEYQRPLEDIAYAGGNNWLVYCDPRNSHLEWNRELYKSTDNGVNWSRDSLLLPPLPYSYKSFSVWAFHARYENILYYYFPSITNADFRLQRTNDAGTTWLKQKYPIDLPRLNAISVVNDRIAYAVGENGTIIKINDITSIRNEQIKFFTDIHIYPNPTSENFSISFPQNYSFKNTRLILRDITGREIFLKEIDAVQDSYTFSVQEIPTGVYMLEVRSGNEVFTKQVSVIR